MKDGASDVIQKPFDSRQVSEGIREALQASGRQTHDQCNEPPEQRVNLKDGVVIAIPGDRNGRRTRVTVGGKPLYLPDASLKVLLRLMIAHRSGGPVNKIELGATADQGFKGISILRNELKLVLRSVDIIKNHYHGDYSFVAEVIIGECAVGKLQQIGDRTISSLATQLRDQRPQNSDGNSDDFPTHRRRRRE